MLQFGLSLYEIECVKKTSEITADEPYIISVGIQRYFKNNELTPANIKNIKITIELFGPFSNVKSGKIIDLQLLLNQADKTIVGNVINTPIFSDSELQVLINPENYLIFVMLLENDFSEPKKILKKVEDDILNFLFIENLDLTNISSDKAIHSLKPDFYLKSAELEVKINEIMINAFKISKKTGFFGNDDDFIGLKRLEIPANHLEETLNDHSKTQNYELELRGDGGIYKFKFALN